MLEIMVTGAIPTRFQMGSWGGRLLIATLLALVPLIAGLILGTPTFAQESEPSATQDSEPSADRKSKPTALHEGKIEATFKQGNETYPAHILLDRVAVVLANEVSANAKRYRGAIQKLGGEPILGFSRNIIAIEVRGVEDVAGLRKFLDERKASWSDQTNIVDTGILVVIGESKHPWILTNKIIVQIADENKPDLINEIAEEFDAEIVRKNPFDPRSFVISVPAANTLEVSNEINDVSGVSFAHPNFYRAGEWRQGSVIPNDEFFSDQWHLHNDGRGAGTEDADIDIDLAWSFGAGNSSIIIAVIDSGFEIDHPDLADGLHANAAEIAGNDDWDDDGNGFVDDVHGWNFASCPNFHTNADPDHCGDGDVTPAQGWYHGNAVAGAALARAYNGPFVDDHHEGVVGTCPNCKLLPVRFSFSQPLDTHQLPIQYAQSMGADVINISWGYPRFEPVTLNIKNAINDAATDGRGGLGAVVFVAMTNESYDNCNPSSPDVPDLSSLPNVIAVGGSTNQDQVSPGGLGDCLDVLAPTDGGTLRAVTTDLQGVAGLNFYQQDFGVECQDPPNRDYTFCFGGLSFSAPLVAGVAGLVLSLDDSLTRLQVQRLLQDTADKISDSVAEYSDEKAYSAPDNGALPKFGYGRINAFEAVRTIADPFGGRGGIDIFLRDNPLDWGNSEQPSSVTFEQTRGFIPYWQSVDIKVDAPPFRTTPPEGSEELICLGLDPENPELTLDRPFAPPATSVEFDCFAHEIPASDTQSQIYVRVHNRGVRPATNVRVKLLWSTHVGADPPNLPPDFWSAFTSHSDPGDTSLWHPLPPQTIAELPYSGASVAGGPDDGSVVLTFDFSAPISDQTQPNSDHFSVLAIVDSPDDPVSAAAVLSQEPSFITPHDNNVSQLTMPLGESIVSDVVQPCDC